MPNTFSVITCTLNRDKFLEKALNTVETQSYKEIEHVIVDGFSTDSTPKIIEAYINRNSDKNVKYVQTEPKGIANAMNIGIKNSTAEIINFLHDDDLYIDNEALLRVSNYFDNNPEYKLLSGNWPLKIGDLLLFIPITKVTKLYSNLFVKIPNAISHENTFVKRELFRKYGSFDESFKYAMDYEYWQRIVLKEKILFVDDYFTIFTSHQNSASHNYRHWPAIIKELIKANQKNKKSSNLFHFADIIKTLRVSPEEIVEYIKKEIKEF